MPMHRQRGVPPAGAQLRRAEPYPGSVHVVRPMTRPTLESFREAFRPAGEREKAHRLTRPGVTDQPCVCCTLTWYCDMGQDGQVYCSICSGRGHDERGDSSGCGR